MALSIRSLTRKQILALALLFGLALSMPAGSAFGDESPDPVDPAEYQPNGVGTLFQSPDLQQGQDPTLYEKYPDSAWQTDWKSKGWTNVVDNTVDPVLNGITNVLLGATKAVTHAAISLSWQMSDFDAFSLLSGEMTDMVGAVANSAIDWLLPTCLAIGAVLVLSKMAIGTGEGLRQFGALILAGAVGVSLAVTPELWTSTIDAIRQVGSQTTAAATTAVTSELDVPFEGPDPTFGNDDGVNAHRQQGDAIWRTYVATPWCIAEFGNLRTCQDYGETVLEKTGEERTDFLDSAAFKALMGGEDSDAWQTITGHDGATRMAIMLPALIVAGIFCGLIIFLNASVLLYLMLALMLLVVGAFFAMMWVIPGKPRQWGMAWAEKLFTFTFMSFIANLVLVVTMLVSMTTMGLSGSYGWGVSSMLTIIAAVASVLLFRHLKEIMGVGNTGALATLGTGAAMGMMGSRALRAGKKLLARRQTSMAEHSPVISRAQSSTQYGRYSPNSPSAPRPTGGGSPKPTGPRRPAGPGPASRTGRTHGLPAGRPPVPDNQPQLVTAGPTPQRSGSNRPNGPVIDGEGFTVTTKYSNPAPRQNTTASPRHGREARSANSPHRQATPRPQSNTEIVPRPNPSTPGHMAPDQPAQAHGTEQADPPVRRRRGRGKTDESR